MKNICEICKNLISRDPKFIDVDKIKVGMKLQSWFETDYAPTHGKYRPRDSYTLIRKIDDDFIYHSMHGYTTVHINMRSDFEDHTLYEITP